MITLSRRWKSWGYVLVWTLTIYSTLSLARPVCEFLRERIALGFFINAAVILSFLGLSVVVLSHSKGFFARAVFVLAGLGYGLGLITLELPEEKIHFFEYGFLAFLVFKAFRVDCSRLSSFYLSLILTTALGFIDEVIQGILPNRYFQWSDVFLNMASALLGLLIVYSQREENVLNN